MKKQKNKNITGIIFDIQKYSLHDGEGIRTLVFMKGCPLKCIWCSNPESHKLYKEIGFIEKKCIKCGKCYDVCKRRAVSQDNFVIDKELCNNCLDCADVCMVGSKRVIGNKITVEKLIEIVEKDRIFYKNSDGGVTVGGGEPAVQSDFVSAFLEECQTLNINTSIETCGYAPWEDLERIIRYTDVVHFDIKQMNSIKHKQVTGVENRIILENAKIIGDYKDIIIRIPIIPGINEDKENITETIQFASTLPKLIRVELLPYHNLGEAKYGWIGKEYSLKSLKVYDNSQKEELLELISAIKLDVPVTIV